MPSDLRLSPRTRRTILSHLGRDRLAEITSRFDLYVQDRRSGDSHIDAIVQKRSLDFTLVLDLLKREELQVACEELGLDTSGREKAKLVERLLSLARPPGGDPDGEDGTPAPEPAPLVLSPAEPKAKVHRTPSAPKTRTDDPITDYRFPDAKRVNNPPAGLVEFDKPPPKKTREYAYDPHLDPQLVWAGKAERTSFEVDTVSLHIHERVSTQAILRAVQREPAQRDLFADTDLPEGKLIDFYSHEVGWANRLALGDSLLVMNSLLERERMAGKVQCIYMDPPYGVQFSSNFQPSIARRDVKDGDDASLTREPEQIQAYRDTWELGIHSYLTYMRDRLLLCRELLGDTGSIFVQISTENLHLVSVLLDEVFGPSNRIELISFRKKTMPLGGRLLEGNCDYLVWYARDREKIKYRTLFEEGSVEGDAHWNYVELPNGTRRQMTGEEVKNHKLLPPGAEVYQLIGMYPTGSFATGIYDFEFEGRTYRLPPGKCWKTPIEGMRRLAKSGRLQPYESGDTLRYVLKYADYPVSPLGNVWADTSAPSDKTYVVQTSRTVVQRCLLMTTDPGDLVLDPTCGSGTTAVVAEQWGRRWVTCDTSRVALSLARQRLLTARFPYYRLRSDRVRDGFTYRTVPHITLKSIAQNARLDGSRSREERELLTRESAEQEILFDQPDEDKGRVRVSGPFTFEAIPVPSLEASAAAAGDAIEIERPTTTGRVDDPAGDYLTMMIDLVQKTGITFPNGRALRVPSIHAVKGPYEYLHAEATSDIEGDPRRIAVSFGPKHGPVTQSQVIGACREAWNYQWIIFIGFACDPDARQRVDAGAQGQQLDFANAAPDILVGDLLKTKKTSTLFTVYGAPDVTVHKEADAMVSVELVGVDIYDPITGNTTHGRGDDVAAWFIDHDYDGRTFCICQALFPGRSTKNPWEKLQKALKGTIDEDRFEQLRQTRCLAFKPGKKIAVTVIDDRGNEVIKVVESKAAR
jgi:adenine-specific DNA-methyltransferase